ncbi:MAG: hypothetical protein KBC56_01250 [Flavobacterium sp.]|nr:hypothetical protein [Flavobacterium sp.]
MKLKITTSVRLLGSGHEYQKNNFSHMRKRIINILMMSLFATTMLAQAPQKMSYQAVVRNAGNTLIANATVGMRISVLQGTANGTAVYVETQAPTTNANGLVTLEIGAGTVVSGTFAFISWGTNNYYIKTETDPTGGTNYTISGTTQLLSVPYALYAGNAGASSQWGANGTDIYSNNLGNVGIGLSIPTAKLDVIGKTKTINLQVTTGAGAGKVLTSDATGNASWQTPVVNQYYNQTCGFSISTQGSIVDIPSSNITVPTSGYYLVTYLAAINNSWYLSCSNSCTEPKVIGTRLYLYQKPNSSILQNQRIDFLNRNNTTPVNGLNDTYLYDLPSHDISGSYTRYFNSGDIIGFKVGSEVSDTVTTGTISGTGEISLIRLY